jgi:hypothetical protein
MVTRTWHLRKVCVKTYNTELPLGLSTTPRQRTQCTFLTSVLYEVIVFVHFTHCSRNRPRYHWLRCRVPQKLYGNDYENSMSGIQPQSSSPHSDNFIIKLSQRVLYVTKCTSPSYRKVVLSCIHLQ